MCGETGHCRPRSSGRGHGASQAATPGPATGPEAADRAESHSSWVPQTCAQRVCRLGSQRVAPGLTGLCAGPAARAVTGCVPPGSAPPELGCSSCGCRGSDQLHACRCDRVDPQTRRRGPQSPAPVVGQGPPCKQLPLRGNGPAFQARQGWGGEGRRREEKRRDSSVSVPVSWRADEKPGSEPSWVVGGAALASPSFSVRRSVRSILRRNGGPQDAPLKTLPRPGLPPHRPSSGNPFLSTVHPHLATGRLAVAEEQSPVEFNLQIVREGTWPPRSSQWQRLRHIHLSGLSESCTCRCAQQRGFHLQETY